MMLHHFVGRYLFVWKSDAIKALKDWSLLFEHKTGKAICHFNPWLFVGFCWRETSASPFVTTPGFSRFHPKPNIAPFMSHILKLRNRSTLSPLYPCHNASNSSDRLIEGPITCWQWRARFFYVILYKICNSRIWTQYVTMYISSLLSNSNIPKTSRGLALAPLR
jgi:hypothetical protein